MKFKQRQSPSATELQQVNVVTSSDNQFLPDQDKESNRLIGEFGTTVNGPLLIFLAGVHGNEPAARAALQLVFEQLETLQPKFRGKIVGLIGNCAATELGCRFIDEDLNRVWEHRRVEAMLKKNDNINPHSHESAEQLALHQQIERHVAAQRANTPGCPVYLIDLHSTSATSTPFIVITDTLSNRRFAGQFHTPIILGLEEQVPGTILSYASQMGIVSMAFEAGQHLDPKSIERHKALIWMAADACGCFCGQPPEALLPAKRLLSSVSANTPSLLEFKQHYKIEPGETFRMKPGFINFDPIEKEMLLAVNQHGEIRALSDGYIFMPLYQDQGRDGYFIVNKISPFWLHLSNLMRRLRLENLLRICPGIHLSDSLNKIRIDRKWLSFYRLRLMHLLGYHQNHIDLDGASFAKRPEIRPWDSGNW